MDVFRGHTYDRHGDPVDPDKRLSPNDHKLFLGERTREIWMRLRTERPNDDLEVLFDEAMEMANRELRRAVRQKKLFRKNSGRPPGQQGSQTISRGLDDSSLRREYKLTRPLIRVGGTAYSAVALHLWRRKYKDVGISWQALRVRLSRACKKLEQK